MYGLQDFVNGVERVDWGHWKTPVGWGFEVVPEGLCAYRGHGAYPSPLRQGYRMCTEVHFWLDMGGNLEEYGGGCYPLPVVFTSYQTGYLVARSHL